MEGKGGTIQMTIKWTLRLALAQQGIFTMAELGRKLEAEVGYPLTQPALHRLAGGKDSAPPKEIKLATLNALLEALNFPATDFGIFQYEPATPANQLIQPLVVNEDAHPTTSRPPARKSAVPSSKLKRTPPPQMG
jgi:hypothetical protein